MKNYLFSLGIIASIIIFNQCNNQRIDYTQGNISESRDSILYKLNTIFVGDSGYILKDNGLEIFEYLVLKDSIISFEYYNTWKESLSADTIGIYYKDEDKNRYHAYLENIISHFDETLILEVDMNKRTIEYNNFVGGMHKCCWDSRFDGFRKVGDYYYVKNCGTGLAYCSSYFHLFKDLSNIGNYITESSSSRAIPSPENEKEVIYVALDSNWKLRNDTIFVHYVYETGISDTTGNDRQLVFKEFNIEYVLREGLWSAVDSTAFESMEYL